MQSATRDVCRARELWVAALRVMSVRVLQTESGRLAPSSVMDPFAEEQRIAREKEQRLAERDQKRREQLEQTRATDSKSAATLMHP